MNKIVIKFLLAGGKFMPEMNLRQPEFNIVLRDHLQKAKKEYKNLKICQKKLHKACFRHDMADGDLSRRKTTDKIFRDKGFDITKNAKYDEYQQRLALVAYNFFDKKTAGGAIENKTMSSKELVE